MKSSKNSQNDHVGSVLVVDDEDIPLKMLSRILSREGYKVATTKNGEKAIGLIKDKRFDVVLTDLFIDTVSGFDILSEVQDSPYDSEVIILTGYGSVDSAIEATKKGAFHYLQKPVRPDEVKNIVKQAMEKIGLKAKIQFLETDPVEKFPSIIGNSKKIRAIKNLIWRIRDSDSNVLITGESGAGKELVAQAIHASSPKKDGRFVAFNCASFSEDLLANELFGHEKDSFTGANSTKPGLLETASGGTVFLDEVGDMPPTMQAKLLRAIQEREIMRVGGNKAIPVEIRIIAATNKDLKALCSSGYFRQDLYFRLNVIHMRMPNLYERKEDIPLLISHFLKKYGHKSSKEIEGFSDEAMAVLTGYEYPGNIRELENIVEHAVSMGHGTELGTDTIPQDLTDYDLFTFHGQGEELKTLQELERDYIIWVLDRVKHKKTEAARILGIDRVSLYRKLKKFSFEE